MGFLIFGIKNAFRGKIRFILSLLLLVIGIAALSFSIGSYYFAEELLQTSASDNGGIDFFIGFDDNQSAGFSNSTFSLEELNKIQSTKGVKEAIGISDFIMDRKKDNRLYSLVLYGFTGKGISNDCRVPGVGHIKLIKGRLPTSGSHEILVTKSMSISTGLKIGEIFTPTSIKNDLTTECALDPNKSKFPIVGLINDLEGPGGIIDLNVGNELLYNSTASNKFKYVAVKADHNQINQTKKLINQSALNQKYSFSENYRDTSGASDTFLYMLLFFVCMGALIMLITILKSVNDRRREIGVLKAVGWSNKRVMNMVFIESITQTIIAWTIALVLLIMFMAVESDIGLLTFFQTNINTVIQLLILTLGMSLLIPVIGSIIPLIYIIRLKPTEALRYE